MIGSHQLSLGLIRLARSQSIRPSIVAVDANTGDMVASPSVNEIRVAAEDAKQRNFERLQRKNDAQQTLRPKMQRQSSDWDSGIRGDMDSHAHQLKMTDFMAVDKYIFPLSVSSMNSNFKFKDYAPLAFRKLRNFWGVEKYCKEMCLVVGNLV